GPRAAPGLLLLGAHVGEPAARLVDARAQLAFIEFDDDVTRLDALAFGDADGADASADFRTDADRARFDGAGDENLAARPQRARVNERGRPDDGGCGQREHNFFRCHTPSR